MNSYRFSYLIYINLKMTLHCLYHTLQIEFYNKIKIEFSRLILTGNKEVEEEALECELWNWKIRRYNVSFDSRKGWWILRWEAFITSISHSEYIIGVVGTNFQFQTYIDKKRWMKAIQKISGFSLKPYFDMKIEAIFRNL